MPLAERVYMVVIFTLTAALLYADQNLMAPNLTAIAREFGFDDRQRDQCARTLTLTLAPGHSVCGCQGRWHSCWQQSPDVAATSVSAFTCDFGFIVRQ